MGDYSKNMDEIDYDRPFNDVGIDVEDDEEEDDEVENNTHKSEVDMTISKAKEHVQQSFNIDSILVKRFGNNPPFGRIYEVEEPEEIKDFVVEIDGAYKGYGRPADTILMDTKQGEVIVMPTVNTTYSDSIIDGKSNSINIGDRLYAICVFVPEDEIYVAVCIIRESESHIFSEIRSAYGRALACRKFYEVFRGRKSAQQFIENQVEDQKYARFDSAKDYGFNSMPELILKYELTKENYPIETQRTIESIFRSQYPNDLKHHDAKQEKRLKHILGISTSNITKSPLDIKKLRKHFDKKIYKMDRVKEQLIGFMAMNLRAQHRGFRILVVGLPGTGKTLILQTLAECINVPCETISFNGLSDTHIMSGLDTGFSDAKPSRFGHVFFSYGTSEVFLILEEFDKANKLSHNGNPYDAMYQPLQGMLEDEFYDCPTPMTNTIIGATANSTDNIPQALLDRFDLIINLDDYTNEDKVEIARRHVIPDIFDNYNISQEEISFSEEALFTLATDYCEYGGVRDLAKYIKAILRNILQNDNKPDHLLISDEDVHRILGPVAYESPGIILNRHSEEYSQKILDEAKKLLCETDTTSNLAHVFDGFSYDKKKEKLDCLLACRTGKDSPFESFDVNFFRDTLHQRLFGMDKLIDEFAALFNSLILRKALHQANYALISGMGTGKTIFSETFAKAIGYSFYKIALSGIDDVKSLRGFPSSYAGSKAGLIMDAIRKTRSLRLVILFDELDKLKPEIQEALIDILDRKYVDNFLEMEIDLSETIMIATANDWNKVLPVIRNRFSVIKVEGYTHQDKAQIITNYIIPDIENNFKDANISISISTAALDYLLKTYCQSFGVRDAERKIEKIVNMKLMEMAGVKGDKRVRISKDDVDHFLGPKPVSRGNIPQGKVKSGVTKALAVTEGIYGSVFAIETVLIDGESGIEITGLPKEMAIDSVKIAVTCIKGRFPDLLKDKMIHVHFGEGSVPKDGPSAGVAIFMSIYSAAIGKPVKYKKAYDIAFTGELSLTGGVFAVGGVYEKLQAACDSGCSKVFVPKQNYAQLDKERLKEFDCKIIPVTDISEVVGEVFA